MKRLQMIVVAVLVASCSAPVDNTAQDARLAFEAYVEALNAANFDSAAQMYDNSEGFHWIERGGVQYESGSDAANSLRALSDSGGKPQMRLDAVRVAKLADGAALVSAQFDFQMLAETGDEMFAFDGWMTVGMVRREKGWRIAGGQTGQSE